MRASQAKTPAGPQRAAQQSFGAPQQAAGAGHSGGAGEETDCGWRSVCGIGGSGCRCPQERGSPRTAQEERLFAARVRALEQGAETVGGARAGQVRQRERSLRARVPVCAPRAVTLILPGWILATPGIQPRGQGGAGSESRGDAELRDAIGRQHVCASGRSGAPGAASAETVPGHQEALGIQAEPLQKPHGGKQ